MAYADRLDTDIDTFLKRHEQKELLRFVTLGSVDDGKSTLIEGFSTMWIVCTRTSWTTPVRVPMRSTSP